MPATPAMEPTALYALIRLQLEAAWQPALFICRRSEHASAASRWLRALVWSESPSPWRSRRCGWVRMGAGHLPEPVGRDEWTTHRTTKKERAPVTARARSSDALRDHNQFGVCESPPREGKTNQPPAAAKLRDSTKTMAKKRRAR